jgi:hypothetical protein
MTLIQTIQERLAKICENIYGGPAHSYASENAPTYRIQDAAIAKCAAAIRAADLSDLEPKGRLPESLIETLRVKRPIPQWAAIEAADTITVLTSENARICAAHKGLMAEADKRLDETEAALTARLEAAEGDARRYQYIRSQREHLMKCFEPETTQFGLADYLDGLQREELDDAIDAALKERK